MLTFWLQWIAAFLIVAGILAALAGAEDWWIRRHP
jgi:hypothetical protein